MASKEVTRDPNKAVVYVMLRLHTDTTRYSQWYFTVSAEKLYKWATVLCSMQQGTVHPDRGSAHYSFQRLLDLVDLSFILAGIWKFYRQFYLTDPHTNTKIILKNIYKKITVKSPEKVLLCKVQKKKMHWNIYREELQGKRDRVSPHQSVLRWPFQPQSGISVVIAGFFSHTSMSRLPTALHPFCLSTKTVHTPQSTNMLVKNT